MCKILKVELYKKYSNKFSYKHKYYKTLTGSSSVWMLSSYNMLAEFVKDWI